jgi:hypothetical protein
MRQGLTMADEAKPPTLEYGITVRERRKFARIYYCIGLPLIAFALCGGSRSDVTGLIGACGAFLVAMALPVRD